METSATRSPIEAQAHLHHQYFLGLQLMVAVEEGRDVIGECVSEDLTGQFGLCGYFQEYDHDLAPDERLRFSPDERPPPFDPAQQPSPPDAHWSEERLSKAARNYAMEYCRNGIGELVGVIGRDRAVAIGQRAARLTGLQQYQHMADAAGCVDGEAADAARFLATALAGMGDEVDLELSEDERFATIHQRDLRIVRGMTGEERENMLSC